MAEAITLGENTGHTIWERREVLSARLEAFP